MGSDEAGVHRRSRVAIAMLAVFACALALPAIASAELFEVNSAGDEQDASVGVDGCLTAGGKCTLRAAIEEANVPLGDPGSEKDEINFAEDVFDGSMAATIVLTQSLPSIVKPLYIRGTGGCHPSEVFDPCVGLSGPADDAALTVQGTSSVEIERLAVTDAEVGIEVVDSTSVKIFKSWLGIKLDGNAGPNETGALYGPGSDGGVIGSPFEGEGNFFAHNTAVGLDLFGASAAEIRGNRFGVAPDGSTPAANGKDIEVTSDATGGTDAVGNRIGDRVGADFAGGPCDRACNLVSGATESGLDLQGDGGDEGPAVATSVAGNYFGLDLAGTGSVANVGAGIRVGAAELTAIGGPRAGDANRFSGGSAAIVAGAGASDLALRGNLVGIGGLGGSVVPPDAGFVLDSGGLLGFADEAIVQGNEIRLEGGVGIAQQALGAWIAGNRVTGAETGIWVHGAGGGNLIEGNTIEQSELEAILIENELNEVVGNRIVGAGTAGIAVRGALPSGVGENLIGGDSAAEENEISGSAGAAVQVTNVEGTMTTVARNRGSANGGTFIDLLATSPGTEPSGPNGGIAPPSILSATSTALSGGGEPGATVRVYRKRSPAAGEIEGFLGAATVDAGGNWTLSYSAPLAAGTAIAASQTSESGGSSELALGLTAGGDPGAGSGGGGDTAAADKKPPRTAILAGPKARSASRTARFRFDSDELGTQFQCRLDRKPFRSCASPRRYTGLRPGKHVFAVRAIDAAGNADPSPAKRAFRVVAP